MEVKEAWKQLGINSKCKSKFGELEVKNTLLWLSWWLNDFKNELDLCKRNQLQSSMLYLHTHTYIYREGLNWFFKIKEMILEGKVQIRFPNVLTTDRIYNFNWKNKVMRSTSRKSDSFTNSKCKDVETM